MNRSKHYLYLLFSLFSVMPERNQAVTREESPTPVRSRLSFQRNPQASWTIERMLHRGQWGIPGLRGLTPISLSPDLKGLIISLSPGLKGFTVFIPVSNIKPTYEGSASPEDLTPIHMIRPWNEKGLIVLLSRIFPLNQDQ